MVRGHQRIERTGGEVADWIGLFSRLIGIEGDGIRLCGGVRARLVTGACRASGVTLGSTVLLSASGWRDLERKSDAGLILLAHELVHVRQYREQGFFRFLSAYAGEYLTGRWRGRSHGCAYREISYEAQARTGEALALYLLERGAVLRGGGATA